MNTSAISTSGIPGPRSAEHADSTRRAGAEVRFDDIYRPEVERDHAGRSRSGSDAGADDREPAPADDSDRPRRAGRRDDPTGLPSTATLRSDQPAWARPSPQPSERPSDELAAITEPSLTAGTTPGEPSSPQALADDVTTTPMAGMVHTTPAAGTKPPTPSVEPVIPDSASSRPTRTDASVAGPSDARQGHGDQLAPAPPDITEPSAQPTTATHWREMAIEHRDPASVESGSVESASVESGAVESASMDSGAVESASAESASVESASVDSGAVESGAAESGAVASTIGDTDLVETDDPVDLLDPPLADPDQAATADVPEGAGPDSMSTVLTDTSKVATGTRTPGPVASVADGPGAAAHTAEQRAAAHAQANEMLARADLQRVTHGGSRLGLETEAGELGVIRIEASDRGDGLQLHLGSERSSTRTVLGEYLQELRDQLRADGFDLGSLDVGTRSGHQHETPARAGHVARASAPDAPASAGATLATAPNPIVPTDGIDLRL